MQYARHCVKILVTASLLATAPITWATTDSAPPTTTGVWQRHQATLNYYGLTAMYTCDGLEDKVRELFRYLGARPDLKVYTDGCEHGIDRPSHQAWIHVDLYTLAIADAGAGDTVPARWSNITIMPNHPNWMGMGECELIDQLKSFVTKSFSLRQLDYQTSCFPREVTIADYHVSGEVLEAAVAGKSG